MSIRESIEKHKGLTAIISVVILLIAAYFSFHNSSMSPATMPNAAYFTTDDGKTLFVDSTDHLAPFDHDGKPASRAWMYTTDGGKTKFLAYLERYTPAAKQRLEKQLADYNSRKSRAPANIGPADTEVKKPGAANRWVNRASPQSSKITDVQTPGGEVAELAIP